MISMLTIAALVLFAYVWFSDFRSSHSIGDIVSAKKQTQGLFISLGIILISLALVNYVLPEVVKFPDSTSKDLAIIISSVLIAGLISFIWYIFISWLDIYEPEKFIYMFITFTLSCGSTFLVFVISPLWGDLGLVLNGGFWNDLVYCVVRIGLTEEFVKFLPFLIMLLFSKQINEPYDYILFGATSALGFAFIENIGYISDSELSYANARAFYSSVAHVFFTGIICYCIAMARHRGKSLLVATLIGFALASFAHGFYDFWLISENYKIFWFTLGFFLISIHLFAIMKNNLINISPFYNPDIRLNVVRNKNRLFNLLLFILFSSYIMYSIIHGVENGNTFLMSNIGSYAAIMIYLVLSFNSTNIIHGYVAPIVLPRVFLLPLINRYPNYLDTNVFISKSLSNHPSLAKILPVSGKLSKRVVVSDDFNWYQLEIEGNVVNSEKAGYIIVKPARTEYHLLNRKYQSFRMALVPKELFETGVSFEKNQIGYLGMVKVRAKINPQQ